MHRHLHATQGSVYAYAPELDEWWSGRRMRLEMGPTPATAVVDQDVAVLATPPSRDPEQYVRATVIVELF